MGRESRLGPATPAALATAFGVGVGKRKTCVDMYYFENGCSQPASLIGAILTVILVTEN